MTCTSACDEQHTFQLGCRLGPKSVDAPTQLLDKGQKAVATPRQFATEHVDQCANILCQNVPGEGKFVVFVAQYGGRHLALAMCAPCAALMRELMNQ